MKRKLTSSAELLVLDSYIGNSTRDGVLENNNIDVVSDYYQLTTGNNITIYPCYEQESYDGNHTKLLSKAILLYQSDNGSFQYA